MRYAHRSVTGRLKRRGWSTLVAALVVAGVAAAPSTATPHRHHGQDLRVHQRNLVADRPGHAKVTDPNLVNAWGLAFGPTTPAWVADNGTGVSTLYRGATAMDPQPSRLPLVVSIPGGAPTGVVWNGGTGFTVHSGSASGPALFLFSSEAGVISGWSPDVPAPGSTAAQLAATVPGAVFKGLAIADTNNGPRLYATDFHNNRVDVWNDMFAPAGKPGAFTDPNLPKGYAPFGIQTVGHRLVVTYAKQDAAAHDDLHGAGFGFVDVYNTSGKLLHRLVSRGPLNAPWGIALAPRHFGGASRDLLIGNFGNGRINAFNPKSGRFEGTLRAHGRKLKIDGLWALQFGNGVIGNRNTLLFTAGPNEESHGLFGSLTAR